MNLAELKQIILEETEAVLAPSPSKPQEQNNQIDIASHAAHNFKQLKYMYGEDGASKMIHHISSLQHNKILRKLGSGAFGVVYALDNDHVIKFFTGGVTSPGGGDGFGDYDEASKEEINKYKLLQSKAFSGKASKNDLPVYDYGVYAKDSDGTPTGYYAEIGKVIPLEDWFRFTGRKEKVEDNSLWVFVNFKESLTSITRGAKKMDDETRKAIKYLFVVYAPKFRAAGCTQEEVLGYFRAVLNLIKKFGVPYGYDVHHQNVGVNMFDPSIMTIYDF